MKDVADHAGVSIRTVSNVVNDFPYVSDEMRRKVQSSLDELGYSMNPVAKGLRSGRTDMIALVVPQLVECSSRRRRIRRCRPRSCGAH
jgi:LacI family repressor for deo operon, udp, cdd, tsx, nupC, and nupG